MVRYNRTLQIGRLNAESAARRAARTKLTVGGVGLCPLRVWPVKRRPKPGQTVELWGRLYRIVHVCPLRSWIDVAAVGTAGTCFRISTHLARRHSNRRYSE